MGVSHAQFFSQYLGKIAISTQIVHWTDPAFGASALRRLRPYEFDSMLHTAVRAARVVPLETVATLVHSLAVATGGVTRAASAAGLGVDEDLRVQYDAGTNGAFEAAAKRLGAMAEVKVRLPVYQRNCLLVLCAHLSYEQNFRKSTVL